MADIAENTIREDYDTYFNPSVYLKQYFKTVDGNPDESGFPRFVMNTLHKVYSQGQITGDCIVDIGSGPSIYSLICAANFFKRIVLTDIAECNRKALQHWVDREPGAHDWEPFFRYHAELDGQLDKWCANQELFRSKVEKVLYCDVLHMNPVHPELLDQVDAVSTSLCLEVACKDIQQYRQALRNVTSLVKPGGHFLLIGVLNQTYYDVGGERFYCLPLKADDIKAAMTDAGLGNTVWYNFDPSRPTAADLSDYAGAFVAVAEKTGI